MDSIDEYLATILVMSVTVCGAGLTATLTAKLVAIGRGITVGGYFLKPSTSFSAAQRVMMLSLIEGMTKGHDSGRLSR